MATIALPARVTMADARATLAQLKPQLQAADSPVIDASGLAELDTAADAFVERLASGPTLAYGAMKRLMRSSFEHDLPSQLAAETRAFAGCAATHDMRTGVEAFFAKQPPQFEGR